MDPIGRSLVFSVGARVIAALAGLLALPLYVSWLGVEAYGIVGLFSSLQVLFVFMDFGLPATLTRELAGVRGDDAGIARGRDVVRSYEAAYVLLGAAVALVFAAAAPWVAHHWVNVRSLSTNDVQQALVLGAFSLAAQWPSTLYLAGLTGLHRQTRAGVSSAVFALLRVGLSLAAIAWQPTLESFFWAQTASAVVQSIVTRSLLLRALPLPGHRARARLALLVEVRHFAGGMTAITVTSIVLSQVDKLVLSYLLNLPDFGVYAVAAALANGLYVLISPVFGVIYPRLSSAWNAGDRQEVAGLYHSSSQLMAGLVMPLAAVIALFPAEALFLLTGDAALAREGAPILAFLVAGCALNGILNIPYALQLAAGWTSLSVWLNLAAIAVVIPATWLAAGRFGAPGGAAVWAGLNASLLLLTPQLLHQQLLPAEKLRWYREDVLWPALVAIGGAAALRWVLPDAMDFRWGAAAALAASWLLCVGATLCVLPRLHPYVRRHLVWSI